MRYRLRFEKRALKDLRKLEQLDSLRLMDSIERLQNDLRGDVRKLTDFRPRFRLRVGNFRVLFDGEVVIHTVVDRGCAY